MSQSYIENARKVREQMDADRAIVQMVNDAGGIRVAITQSDKVGYDWKITYVNEIPVKYEYIEQENPKGVKDNPFPWNETLSLIPNACTIFYNCAVKVSSRSWSSSS